MFRIAIWKSRNNPKRKEMLVLYSDNPGSCVEESICFPVEMWEKIKQACDAVLENEGISCIVEGDEVRWY